MSTEGFTTICWGMFFGMIVIVVMNVRGCIKDDIEGKRASEDAMIKAGYVLVEEPVMESRGVSRRWVKPENDSTSKKEEVEYER